MDPTGRVLIVTADDFGLSRGVDEGILTAHREGIVTNTALMVNFPELDESVDRLRGATNLDVGVHLNLTAGHPVSPASRVSSLVDRDGRFLPLRQLLTRIARAAVRRDDVRRECDAQLHEALRRGLAISSVSSHQHVHMLPPLTAAVAGAAMSHGVPFVRLSSSWPAGLHGSVKWLAISATALLARATVRAMGLRHNQSVLPLVVDGDGAATRLDRSLRRLRAGVSELVCHPGYVDPMLKSRDPYVQPRLDELALITAVGLRRVVAEEGIQLSGYRDLVSQPRPSGALLQRDRVQQP
jgi:predicted glycoside hydrolase/deacetylase ChbG (UPF0249 family)